MGATAKRAKKLRKGFELITRELKYARNPCRAVIYYVRGTNGRRKAIHCLQLVRNVSMDTQGRICGVVTCPGGHADESPEFINPVPPAPKGRGRLKKRPDEEDESEEVA